MQRVFAIIRPDELQGMLKEMLIQMVEMAGQHLDLCIKTKNWIVMYTTLLQQMERKPGIPRRNTQKSRKTCVT